MGVRRSEALEIRGIVIKIAKEFFKAQQFKQKHLLVVMDEVEMGPELISILTSKKADLHSLITSKMSLQNCSIMFGRNIEAIWKHVGEGGLEIEQILSFILQGDRIPEAYR